MLLIRKVFGRALCSSTAGLEVVVPGGQLGGDLGGVGGQPRLREEVLAVVHGAGADVDREADELAVLAGGLLQLPRQVLRDQLVRADGLQVDEPVRVGQERGDVLALDAGDVRGGLRGPQAGEQLGLEVAADHGGLEADVGGEVLLGVRDDLVAQAAGPVPEGQVLVVLAAARLGAAAARCGGTCRSGRQYGGLKESSTGKVHGLLLVFDVSGWDP